MDSVDSISPVAAYFDHQYRRYQRYWWRGDNRYSIDPYDHAAFNGAVLRLAKRRGPGRALDIGAGEGADSVRLAKLGYQVDAVELSAVACEKMERFARIEGVLLNVRNESVAAATLSGGMYDVVIMNGILHYIDGKEDVLCRVAQASAPDAIHVISLFSTATPLPAEHGVVPVFPDDEGGVVEKFYAQGAVLAAAYQRSKLETAHPSVSRHVHSHVKMIVELTSYRTGVR